MSLTDEQKQEIQEMMECEGEDYYFSCYVSPTSLEKQYNDKKLVELHRQYLKAREELLKYVE